MLENTTKETTEAESTSAMRIAIDMKIAHVLISCVCLLVYGCQSSRYDSDTELDTQAIVNEINAIRSESPIGCIPAEKWPTLLEDLEPIRIYSHLANIAVVLSEDETMETGIYIYQPISSSRPETFDGWSYENIGNDIWKYTHNKIANHPPEDVH